MKILIIGRGAREHCLAWKCKQSNLVSAIFVAKGNDAIGNIASIIDIDESDIEGLLNFALKQKINLTIVGTETPLEIGIADLFILNGLTIFAPTKKAAQIETSKDFAKKMMKKTNIPTASYETFTNFESAKLYVENKGVPIVIKNDGLAAGKGVVVAMQMAEAIEALHEFLNNEKFGTKRVVIEEYLEGEEFTLMCLVHKNRFIALPPSQDHKRAFDNDQGPNTGGMGAYCDVPQIKCYEEAIETVIKPLIVKMNEEDISFTGFLYAGLMQTKNGLKVIEFNARFGDPECEVLLPVLDFDLVATIIKLMDETIEFSATIINQEKKSLGVVIASKGYPEKADTGHSIAFPENDEILVFHAGTTLKNLNFISSGGRVAVIVATDIKLEKASEKVYNYIESMKLSENFYYRKDIGSRALHYDN